MIRLPFCGSAAASRLTSVVLADSLLMVGMLAGPACAPAARSPHGAPARGTGRGSAAGASPSRQPVPGAPAGVTAFVDVTVIPMDREHLLAHQTVLVRQGWIAALGPARRVRVPPAALRIDGRGKFLLPGPSECHGHLGMGTNSRDTVRIDYDTVVAAHKLFLFLVNGVTTGQWVPNDWYSGATKAKPESVATYVAACKAAGYDFLKVHDSESYGLVDSLVAAARRMGLPVVGHVTPDESIEHALTLGYTSIEHLTGYDPQFFSGASPSPSERRSRPPRGGHRGAPWPSE